MTYTWDILIATIGQRRDRFERLTTVLLPQLDPYNGRVRVIALYNNGERPLSHVRQALLEHSTADYVSFIDDDDLVPDYFVREVMIGLEHQPEGFLPFDYVGWQMQCYQDGNPLKPTFHSLHYGHWFDDARGYYRDVSHLNPTLRSQTQHVDFRRGDPPEDVSWADQLRGVLTHQVYIDKIMYFYYSSSIDSTWRGNVRAGDYYRLDVNHPHFTYHPWSSA